jgi:hypothetical protein
MRTRCARHPTGAAPRAHRVTQVYLPGALNGRIRPQKWEAMLIGHVESFFIIRVIQMPAGKGISLHLWTPYTSPKAFRTLARCHTRSHAHSLTSLTSFAAGQNPRRTTADCTSAALDRLGSEHFQVTVLRTVVSTVTHMRCGTLLHACWTCKYFKTCSACSG